MSKIRSLAKQRRTYSHTEPIVEVERDAEGKITGRFQLGWRDLRHDGRQLGDRLFSRRKVL